MPHEPDTPFVEVVHALPTRQWVVRVPLTDGLTAIEAVRASGILDDAPGLETGEPALGIWGRRVNASQPLHAGERVEIYRPLRCDPREARRQAAGPGIARGKKRTATRSSR